MVCHRSAIWTPEEEEEEDDDDDDDDDDEGEGRLLPIKRCSQSSIRPIESFNLKEG